MGEWRSRPREKGNPGSCASPSPSNKTKSFPGRLALINSSQKWHVWCCLNRAKMKLLSPYSTLLYEFGVANSFSSGFRLSVGYLHRQSSLPNDRFSVAIPDSDRNFSAIGFGQ